MILFYRCFIIATIKLCATETIKYICRSTNENVRMKGERINETKQEIEQRN